MRILLLSLIVALVGCASGNKPSDAPQSEIDGVMVCVHKYDPTLGFKFKETDVKVYEQEMFGNVIRIYEILTIDGQTIHLNDAQKYNFNCFYP